MKSILNENAFEEERKTGYGLWLYLLLAMVSYNGIKAALRLVQNLAAFDLVNLIYALLLVLIAIATIIGFFARKRWTPMLFICFFVVNLLYIVYISIALASKFPDRIDYFSLVRVIVMCIIVIPYMLRSERVKEVFVN